MRYEDLLAMGGDHEREARAMMWAVERGHSYEVKCFDGWIGWEWRKETGYKRRHLRIDWARFPDWLGDRFRFLGMKARVYRDRILGVRNPYLVTPGQPR